MNRRDEVFFIVGVVVGAIGMGCLVTIPRPRGEIQCTKDAGIVIRHITVSRTGLDVEEVTNRLLDALCGRKA